jgi:hypothetical protein
LFPRVKGTAMRLVMLSARRSWSLRGGNECDGLPGRPANDCSKTNRSLNSQGAKRT